MIARIVFPLIFAITFFTYLHSDPPDRTEEGEFINPHVDEYHQPTLFDKLWWKFSYYFLQKPLLNNNFEYTIIPEKYVNPPERFQSGAITWVGHSTFLIQIDGLNILTDPVWSERVGVLNSRIGLQRYTPPGIPAEKLPPIDVVLISHNHYDHLDYNTVLFLENEHQPVFLVPLGVGDLLEQWEISNIIERTWWEGKTIETIDFISVPAQHQSRRNLHDHNMTLWSGWVIDASDRTLYFAGDTGYFPGFSEIGERYGPIDVALLPIGAYEPRWYNKVYHLNPSEALQAFKDLDARYFAAMHWGTFDQSEERLSDPPRELLRAARRSGIDSEKIWIFAFGEMRAIPGEISEKTITLQKNE